jgi:WD40 repeat protein/serine/threonine protein kinase
MWTSAMRIEPRILRVEACAILGARATSSLPMAQLREAYECGGARGFRYATLPRALTDALPSWIASERVPEGVDLKPGSVWRVGEHVVKLSKPAGALDKWVRASSSVRAADLHDALQPIRTPRPLLALERRAGRRLAASWLISEHVAGEHLNTAWKADAAARAALPEFLARMHAHGVLHGDLNARNLIWTGREWVLIDLEGVRRGLQALRARSVVEQQWARIAATLRGRARGLRALCATAAGERSDVGRHPRASAPRERRLRTQTARARDARYAVTTTRWRRALDLFERCIDVPSRERGAWLDRNCAADPALRGEVEELLRRDADAGSAMEPSQAPAVDAALGADRVLGRRAGPWLLVRHLASGGMGEVFVGARADESFEKRVAIKWIRGAAWDVELAARFRRERQALARLEHPYIARLIDGGAAQDGSPYLVMEYVEGIALDRWCDEHRATTRERIELVRKVCEAVHYAHQSLVVHRDLKPGNILVGAEGTPKLLDFGIAKVLAGDGDGPPPEMTATELRVLTPRYASPEQIRGEPVTTASDVYSLGVVLYELLCGSSPYGATTRSGRELERSVCDTAPPRPSQTVLRERRADVAASRGTTSERLARELGGDLDTIVQKCLAKEPSRRYASAERLSEDLQRHLMHRPVEARGDSWRYLSGRFVRRNRAGVVAGVVVLVSLVAGLATSTYFFEHTKRALEASEFRAYVAQISAASGALAANSVTDARRALEACPPQARGWEWWYEWRQLDTSELTLRGHRREVRAVAWSADGSMVATGSLDATVKVWSADDGRELATFPTDGSQVWTVAFAPRGSLLAAGSDDGDIRLWDVAALAPLATIHAHSAAIVALAFSPDGARLASAGNDRKWKVWDVASRELALDVAARGQWLLAIAFDPGGRRAAVSSQDGGFSLCDAQSGEELECLSGTRSMVYSAAFRPDGLEFASGSSDREIRVWDALTGEVRQTLHGHTENVHSVAYTPDGRQLFSASTDRTVRLWDVSSGENLATLLGHEAEVCSVALSPDGRRVASASEDHTAKIWSRDELVPLLQDRSERWACAVCCSADGRWIAGSLDVTATDRRSLIRVWDARTRELHSECTVPDYSALAIAFAPRGDEIAVGDGNGWLHVFDVATGRELRATRAHETLIMAVAYAPDGRELATAARDDTAKTWTAGELRLAHVLAGHTQGVVDVAYAPDGRTLATCSYDGTARTWRASDGSPWNTWTAHGSGATSIAISPDGQQIATGGRDGSCATWELASGRRIATLSGHSGVVNAVRYAPDGSRLFSCSQDTTVRVWDLAHAACVATLLGHAYGVAEIAVAPDGAWLASASNDRTVRLWLSVPPARRGE